MDFKQLRMTPQLLQAIELLQMSSLEIEALILEEMLEAAPPGSSDGGDGSEAPTIHREGR